MTRHVTRPRLLDLFCGAGGAAMGYHRAGFDVVGVDIRPQPRYPFTFHQADAMTWPLDGFDAIHASPPCQAYSSATKAWRRTDQHPDLLGPVRDRLTAAGVPWVIENVPGAPVRHGVVLCGSMFGLDVQRHRHFETSDLMLMDRHCQHTGRSLTVTGHGAAWWAGGARTQAPARTARTAMGIDWMTLRELVQAIPPAYTEWIGTRLLAELVTM